MSFSRWNWSSAKTRRNMSFVRMCWRSISRTSAADTSGLIDCLHSSRKPAAAAM